MATQPTDQHPSASTPHRLWGVLQRDWIAILGYVLVTLAATFPLITHLGGDWMPAFNSEDMKLKLWDLWRMQRMTATGAPLFHTTATFAPRGISLLFHSTSHTTTLVMQLIATALGNLTAYKVVALLGLLITAYAAYLLIVDLVGRRVPAWLGGAIYAFAPFHIAHTFSHPDLTQLAPLPLAAMLLIRALTTASLPAAVGAGLMVGLAGWTSLYVLIFTGFTLAPLAVYYLLEGRRWQQRRTWLLIGVIALLSVVTVAPRFAPALLHPATLSEAVEAKIATDVQIDLAAYVIPTHHTLLTPLLVRPPLHFHLKMRETPPYLGIVPLLLAVVALIRYRRKGLIWLWAALAVLFAVLSLGPTLEFAGHDYPSIALPARLLYGIGPIEAIRPYLWVVPLLLPLAVLAAFGLDAVLSAVLQPAVRAALTVALIALVMFEYWVGPIDMERLRPSDATQWIAAQGGDFALVNLPITYGEGKQYLLEQTQHGHPIAGGMIGRMPADAYATIDANPLLHAWRAGEGCLGVPPGGFERAIDAVLADGIRYVVIHWEPAEARGVKNEFREFFADLQPVYADDEVSIYAVADLRGVVCPNAVSALTSEQAAPTLSIPDSSGARACGAFDLRGHGWKLVTLGDFPPCLRSWQPATALRLQCLDGAGAWQPAAITDFDIDPRAALVTFTAHQDGTCGLFVGAPGG